MGLLGNASLSSYLPSSDIEEECLKSSQPCDVGNPAVDETYSPHNINCSIISTENQYPSTAHNDPGHAARLGPQDALRNDELVPSVVRDDRSARTNERFIFDWQEKDIDPGVELLVSGSLKRTVPHAFEQSENEDILGDAGNTAFWAPFNTTETSLSTTRRSSLMPKGNWDAQSSDNSSILDEGKPRPKRPRRGPELERSLKLACPFYKNDPRKYNIQTNRVCASRAWDSVSRVKEHLYRCHLAPPYCQRCKEVFGTEQDLKSHLVDRMPCYFKEGDPPDGISAETQKALKSRKKAGQNVPQKERWKEIYQMLFPGHDIPDPSFDTVQELIDLGDFETYFRQELPKLVRSDLEVEASRKQRALHDILLPQTVQTVQRYHDLVLSSYRDSWPRRQIPSIPVTAPPKSLAETYMTNPIFGLN
ncbi:uncharacterized protein K444DRAFT_611268 [Hyaloscypha bicolor E]|uniref:C2H2-type domain-containing protein n=1 Tax=Hyaloscypha bicolor E TaxID=1095630 RepID=A0A2J6TGA8_9HELO|nr:uncharacterized protein K444DRAFT_611268 [Hyaloscypha bicolor E]PMD62059.1 hypothetical protein K444DRAFT_611268 [Hyaloscypha bicolor E]